MKRDDFPETAALCRKLLRRLEIRGVSRAAIGSTRGGVPACGGASRPTRDCTPEQITFTQFWSFAWRQRRELLLRYLRWAERMN